MEFASLPQTSFPKRDFAKLRGRPIPGEGATMDAANLSITLFILGCAVPFALEAIKLTDRVRWVLAAISGSFVILGFSWLPIARASPAAASFVGGIVSEPVSWFILVVVVLAMLREWVARRRAEAAAAQPLSANGGQIEQTVVTDAISRLMQGQTDLLISVGNLRGDLTTTNTAVENATEMAQAAKDTADRSDATAAFLTGLVEKQLRNFNSLKETVDDLVKSRFAQKTRVALDRLEAELDRLDDTLYFAEGEGIESADWSHWLSNEGRWRSTVRTWTIHGSQFVPGDLMDSILNTPQDSFYGSWSFKDSDLPNADTIHRYKAFCIMRRNFKIIRDDVDQAIWRESFH